jgi:hypothetical protein
LYRPSHFGGFIRDQPLEAIAPEENPFQLSRSGRICRSRQLEGRIQNAEFKKEDLTSCVFLHSAF